GSPERLDLCPTRLAECLLDSMWVLDGSGDDVANGLNGRGLRHGNVAIRLEAIQIEHRVTSVLSAQRRGSLRLQTASHCAQDPVRGASRIVTSSRGGITGMKVGCSRSSNSSCE